MTTTDPVPDRDRISPEVLDPAQHGPVNPTQITVQLQPGFPLGDVKSHHHAVKVEQPSGDKRVIRLADGPVPADRDFELTWKPAAEKAPSVGLFRERVGNADYLLAYVTPPTVEQAEQKPLPREAIFVIDNSGSMGGTSMAQAKASLIYALGRLQPGDRFNVIRFDHTMDVLFPDAVPADAENVARAKGFVGALQASGGTEMVPAMRAALNDRGSDAATHVRQVVFLTDGAIGNEQQLFDTISAHARTLAGVHGRHRLGAEQLPDDAGVRARTRRVHPHRLGRAGGRADARPVRQAGKPGGHRHHGEVLRCHGRHDAGGDPRPLSRRTAGARGKRRNLKAR